MPTSRRRYNSDVTDTEWRLLEPLVPPPKPGGRPCRWSRREILNGIFYELRSGCAWRLLPHDLPPWQTVYHYLRLWRRDGTLEVLHTRLREQVRRRLGREPTPSAAILDSQSVKTAERGGSAATNGGKKIKGRKRHLLVDTQGLILKVVVHAADVQDRDGGRLVLEAIAPHFPRLRHLWVDAGYRGQFVSWVQLTLGWNVQVVQHWWTGVRAVWVPAAVEPPPLPSGFHVLPKRWIVERTFSWLGKCRRLSKDYEYLPATSETLIYTAMSWLMLRRLARRAQ
jgi:transposase